MSIKLPVFSFIDMSSTGVIGTQHPVCDMSSDPNIDLHAGTECALPTELYLRLSRANSGGPWQPLDLDKQDILSLSF